jgi:hypothetical protein
MSSHTVVLSDGRLVLHERLQHNRSRSCEVAHGKQRKAAATMMTVAVHRPHLRTALTQACQASNTSHSAVRVAIYSRSRALHDEPITN